MQDIHRMQDTRFHGVSLLLLLLLVLCVSECVCRCVPSLALRGSAGIHHGYAELCRVLQGSGGVRGYEIWLHGAQLKLRIGPFLCGVQNLNRIYIFPRKVQKKTESGGMGVDQPVFVDFFYVDGIKLFINQLLHGRSHDLLTGFKSLCAYPFWCIKATAEAI